MIMIFSYMHSVLGLTLPNITGKSSADAFSKVAQRLMLPEITRVG